MTDLKVFWWSEVDQYGGYAPSLYCLNLGNVIPQYDTVADLNRLLAEGYVEISTMTAAKLGFPI